MPVLTADLASIGAFGAGGSAPYDRALRDRDRTLSLHERHADSTPRTNATAVDVARYLAGADETDECALENATGPILDVGCGPGRIVRAAIMAGHLALGIDVSSAAVEIAQERGLPVLRRSVFDDLPADGTWGTVVLLDGNIGIGGDPAALLRRCAQLAHPRHGRVLVETHDDPLRDRIFDAAIVDDLGRESLHFPWAEIGAIALDRYARLAGLTSARKWTSSSRNFAEYSCS